ncbi:Arg81 protein [Saccharomycopsis crataegensis]|uniref:Arg81 protein n=1 Tax=Saccharomycopsis crataegensis TaxID=43959 RepID=A0AAV5QT08_9ASCO|nr:Arg81 protein [Saccharomycopsis crataegensis]
MGVPKVKRKKTFTGCWTCRARKVKCDTTKPACNRCKKAGIECDGYDIKLRWSKPLNFHRDGTPVAENNSNFTGTNEEEGSKNGANNGYFQRRNVEFVKYPKGMVYIMYEDMDKDLSILHSAVNLQPYETKKLGPFGVFMGDEKLKRKNQRSSNKNDSKRKKLESLDSQKSPAKLSDPLDRLARNSISNDTDINGTPLPPPPESQHKLSSPNSQPQNNFFVNHSDNNEFGTLFADSFGPSMTLFEQPSTSQINHHHHHHHHHHNLYRQPSQHHHHNNNNTNTNTNNINNNNDDNNNNNNNNNNDNNNDNNSLNNVSLPSYESQQVPFVRHPQSFGYPNHSETLPLHQNNNSIHTGLTSHNNLESTDHHYEDEAHSTNNNFSEILAPSYDVINFNTTNINNSNDNINPHDATLNPHDTSFPVSNGMEVSRLINGTTTTTTTATPVTQRAPHKSENKSKTRSLKEIESIYCNNSENSGFNSGSLFVRPMSMEDSSAPFVPQGYDSVSTEVLVPLPLTRLLMSNYVHHVADLMTVLVLPRNPWKTIYVSRAFKAIGDVLAVGYSDSSNHCTLNAIISVSAFYFRNKFQSGTEPYRYWNVVGYSARNTAKDFLNDSIEHDLYQQKYKDVLVSILSMSTIDVASGSMKSCKAYLDLCEEFIGNRMKKNRKLSPKAKTLHRIFSFHKCIEESTQIFPTSDTKEHPFFELSRFDLDGTSGISAKDESIEELRPRTFDPKLNYDSISYYNTNTLFEDIESDIAGSSFNSDVVANPKPASGITTFREKINDKGRVSIELLVNSNHGSPMLAPQSPKFIEAANENFALSPKYHPRYDDEYDADDIPLHRSSVSRALKTKSDTSSFSTDELFGLPNSIIKLFGSMVELFKLKIKVLTQVWHDRNKGQKLEDSTVDEIGKFKYEAAKFEKALNAWKLEWSLFKYDRNHEKEYQTATHKAIYFHILSFKDGISVYFYRIIKHVPYHEVEPYITSCMNNLMEIGKILTSNKAVIVPIFWQAFIAGSEANTPELQQKFADWCLRMGTIGINNYSVSYQLLNKIWEGKKRVGDDFTWIHAIRDYDVTLMLT